MGSADYTRCISTYLDVLLVRLVNRDELVLSFAVLETVNS